MFVAHLDQFIMLFEYAYYNWKNLPFFSIITWFSIMSQHDFGSILLENCSTERKWIFLNNQKSYECDFWFQRKVRMCSLQIQLGEKKGYKKGYINQIVNDRRVILKIVNFRMYMPSYEALECTPFCTPFPKSRPPFCTPFRKSFYNTNHHSQPHSVDFVGFSRFMWKTLDYWMP